MAHEEVCRVWCGLSASVPVTNVHPLQLVGHPEGVCDGSVPSGGPVSLQAGEGLHRKPLLESAVSQAPANSDQQARVAHLGRHILLPFKG